MRAIIYTDDMEPITVINLPIQVHKFEFKMYRVAVHKPLSMTTWDPSIRSSQESFHTVNIYVERFHRKDKIYPLFITNDEELALQLKSEPLPGQLKDYQDEYIKGFAKALAMAIRGDK